MKYFLKCWKHYADFKGRARRKEYWMFLLFYTIISLVLGFVLGIGLVVQNISSISMYNSITTNPFVFFGIGKGWVRIVFFVCAAFTLASLLPYFAVTVRRLHDIGQKGTWLLLLLIQPIFGLIVLFNMDSVTIAVIFSLINSICNMIILGLYIILGCIDGQKGENQYGPNPKEVEAINNGQLTMNNE